MEKGGIPQRETLAAVYPGGVGGYIYIYIYMIVIEESYIYGRVPQWGFQTLVDSQNLARRRGERVGKVVAGGGASCKKRIPVSNLINMMVLKVLRFACPNRKGIKQKTKQMPKAISNLSENTSNTHVRKNIHEHHILICRFSSLYIYLDVYSKYRIYIYIYI